MLPRHSSRNVSSQGRNHASLPANCFSHYKLSTPGHCIRCTSATVHSHGNVRLRYHKQQSCQPLNARRNCQPMGAMQGLDPSVLTLQDVLRQWQSKPGRRSGSTNTGSNDTYQLCQGFLGWWVWDRNSSRVVGQIVEVELVFPDDDEDSEEDDEDIAAEVQLQAVDDVQATTAGGTSTESASHQQGTARTAAHHAAMRQVMLHTEHTRVLELQGTRWKGVERHMIPVVEDLLPAVQPAAKTLFAALPQGFLDLGRRRLLIDYLGHALLPYAQPNTVDTKRSTRSVQAATTSERTMPTTGMLKAAGRHDFAKMVRRAGGYSSVAAQLGWTCYRRPTGYYDDYINLEQEIHQLVCQSWREMADDTTSKTCYYNEISGDITLRDPATMPASAQPRVIPSFQQLRAAGRGDIIGALYKFGGIDAVAELLDRTPVSQNSLSQTWVMDDEALAHELDAIVKELALHNGSMPTLEQLLKARRMDLIRAIRLRGGWAATSQQLGRAAQRNGRGYMADIDNAACAMLQFMLSRLLPRPSSLNKKEVDTEVFDKSRVQELKEKLRQAYGRIEAAKQSVGFEDTTNQPSYQNSSARNKQRRPAWPAGPPRLPTMYALMAAGRHDLVYAMRLHGRKQLEERCGIPALPGYMSQACRSKATTVPKQKIKNAILGLLKPAASEEPAPLQKSSGHSEQAPSSAQAASAYDVQTCELSSFNRVALQRALASQGLVATRQQIRGILTELKQNKLIVEDRTKRTPGFYTLVT